MSLMDFFIFLAIDRPVEVASKLDGETCREPYDLRVKERLPSNDKCLINSGPVACISTKVQSY